MSNEPRADAAHRGMPAWVERACAEAARAGALVACHPEVALPWAEALYVPAALRRVLAAAGMRWEGPITQAGLDEDAMVAMRRTVTVTAETEARYRSGEFGPWTDVPRWRWTIRYEWELRDPKGDAR